MEKRVITTGKEMQNIQGFGFIGQVTEWVKGEFGKEGSYQFTKAFADHLEAWSAKHKAAEQREMVLGRIGDGKFIHQLFITFIPVITLNGEAAIYIKRAYDNCGSSKWTMYGSSKLTVTSQFVDDTNKESITCNKCRKAKGMELTAREPKKITKAISRQQRYGGFKVKEKYFRTRRDADTYARQWNKENGFA